ncbi:MAG TPA: UbiX family flavin prenyltransferase [candidate division Zixibacteria bacterium]|nr:UbiX family flavin prenyltransferase [candidate division Zixibacteria bacterium]
MTAGNTNPHLPVALGITGASGSVYGARLLQCLTAAGIPVHLVVSEAARIVIKEELGVSVRELAAPELVTLHGNGEIAAEISSGSYRLRGTVICPCSANSIGAIAQGVGDNLIARIGAVALKERWPFIVVPRETPYSAPVLENMKLLALYGAHVLPASPSFYRRPATIEELVDTIVDRILVMLGLDPLLPPWTGPSQRK